MVVRELMAFGDRFLDSRLRGSDSNEGFVIPADAGIQFLFCNHRKKNTVTWESLRASLFYIKLCNLDVWVFAVWTSARFGETGPFFKDKATGKTCIWWYHEFFALALQRTFNMTQMIHNLFFLKAHCLREVPDSKFFWAQEINYFLPFGLPVFCNFHESLLSLYSRT